VIMRPVAIAFSFFLLIGSEQQHQKPQAPQQATQQEQRGTDESPIVVKILPTTKNTQEAKEETQDRKEKAANEGNLVNWVLAGIGVLQLIVFGAQAVMLKQAVDASAQQSVAMQQHIEEASRSANAMEEIAKTIDEGNQAVMRAYLTVTIGGAIYQQRRGPGQTDLKFEAKPTVVNTGNTQARKVSIRKNAAILEAPWPDDFKYPEIAEGSESGFATVAAHQSYVIGAIVPDFVPAEDIQAIKEGNGKALHVWGIITYEDIFGKPHMTKFGQTLTWLPDGKVFGYYTPGANDSD
jgi:hypothetical protein